MNTATHDTLAGTPNKPLWAAVGVLAIAVLGLGGALVYTQMRPAGNAVSAQAALSPATESLVAPTVSATTTPQDEVAAPAAPALPPVVVAKPPVVKKVAKPAPAHTGERHTTVAAATVIPAPVPEPAARPICGNCGTIASATPVQRKGKASGLGAVGGGVLGAVLGSQIGKGSGRTAATVIGAVGGGVAGNAIEKNVKKETVYEVQVRMEDGSTRSYEQAAMPAVGARVVVENGVWRTVDGQ